jgi:hypothetical protein
VQLQKTYQPDNHFVLLPKSLEMEGTPSGSAAGPLLLQPVNPSAELVDIRRTTGSLDAEIKP